MFFYTCLPHLRSSILDSIHSAHSTQFWVQSSKLLSTHANKWRKWRHRWSHSYWVGGFKRLVRLRSRQKTMGSCTAQCKKVLFCANTILRVSAKFELARLKKEEEEEEKDQFWRFGNFLVRYFRDRFSRHWESPWPGKHRWIVSCHKALAICSPFLRFREILKDFFNISI